MRLCFGKAKLYDDDDDDIINEPCLVWMAGNESSVKICMGYWHSHSVPRQAKGKERDEEKAYHEQLMKQAKTGRR